MTTSRKVAAVILLLIACTLGISSYVHYSNRDRFQSTVASQTAIFNVRLRLDGTTATQVTIHDDEGVRFKGLQVVLPPSEEDKIVRYLGPNTPPRKVKLKAKIHI